MRKHVWSAVLVFVFTASLAAAVAATAVATGLATAPPAAALAADPLWASVYAGPAGTQNRLAQGVAVDASGASYVAGAAYAHKFGDSPTVPWLVKYAPDGSLVWERSASAVVANGQFVGVTAMSNGDLLAWGRAGTRGAGILVVRYRTDGTRLWATKVMSHVSKGSEAYDVAVDSRGAVYVAGTIGRLIGSDAILVKLAPSGRMLWQRTIAGGSGRLGGLVSVAVGRNDDVYACGSVRDQGLFVSYSPSGTKRWSALSATVAGSDLVAARSGAVYLCARAGATHHTALLRAYSPGGRLLWGRRVSPQGRAGGFTQVRLDAGGHLICAGGLGGDTPTTFLVAKFTTHGSLVFRDAWSPGKGAIAQAQGLECAADGSIFVCGTSLGPDADRLVVVPYSASGSRGEPMLHETPLYDEFAETSALSPSGPIIVGWLQSTTDWHVNAITVQFPTPAP
jgi:outer membrane protein assembly factor BamB